MSISRLYRSPKILAVAALGTVAALLMLPGGERTPFVNTVQPAAEVLNAMVTPQPVQAATVPVATEATPGTTASSEPLVAAPVIAPVQVALAASPAPQAELSGERAYIGGVAVNVRGGPSKDSPKLFVAQAGAAVTTGAEQNGWVEIAFADGAQGWVYSQYLSGSEPRIAEPVAKPKVVAALEQPRKARKVAEPEPRQSGDLVVQAAPQRGAPTLFVLSPGDRVEVSERRGRWLRVETENGISGWVRTN